jgi:hypothetical protein
MSSGWPLRVLVDGDAVGTVLVLDETLSFWGGLDPETGLIVGRHPQAGRSVKGRIVVMPGGRGSSSSSSVLAEALRAGTGPAAIVLGEPDEIIALGAIVARELYGAICPVAVLEGPLAGLSDGVHVEVRPGGSRLELSS